SGSKRSEIQSKRDKFKKKPKEEQNTELRQKIARESPKDSQITATKQQHISPLLEGS
ncbi:hypothetical protein KI387_029191, partial [Taxus chinensis]